LTADNRAFPYKRREISYWLRPLPVETDIYAVNTYSDFGGSEDGETPSTLTDAANNNGDRSLEIIEYSGHEDCIDRMFQKAEETNRMVEDLMMLCHAFYETGNSETSGAFDHLFGWDTELSQQASQYYDGSRNDGKGFLDHYEFDRDEVDLDGNVVHEQDVPRNYARKDDIPLASIIVNEILFNSKVRA